MSQTRSNPEVRDMARQISRLKLELQQTRSAVIDIADDAVKRATKVEYARQLNGEHIGREVEVGKHFIILIEHVNHDGHTTWLNSDYGVLSGTRVTLR